MLASDSASAMVSTLASSASSTGYQPFLYSEQSSIAPPQAVQMNGMIPISGTDPATGRSIFTINKTGFLTDCTLAYRVTISDHAGPAANNYVANAALHCIREVVLSTQSRPLCTLQRETLLSLFSSAGGDGAKGAYVQAVRLGAAGVVAAAADDTVYDIYINLPLFFRHLSRAILTTFTQQIQIEVNWASFKSANTVFEWGTDVTITNPTLYTTQKSLMQQETERVTNELYDSGLLTTLIRTYETENVVQYDIGAGVGTDSLAIPFNVPIRSASCVTRCWIMAMVTPETPWTNGTPTQCAAARGKALPLSGSLVFTSNGMEHVSAPSDILRYYGHKSQEAFNGGFSGSQHAEATGAASGLDYCYMFDFGSGSEDTTKLSNYLSLRELQNASWSGTVAPSTALQSQATSKISIYVVWERLELMVCTSSNGRLGISLGN